MKVLTILGGLLLGILMACATSQADEGLLYGKVYTVDNDVFEGFIRWDRNEASWVNILDGDKELDRKRHRKDRHKRYRPKKKVSIFGVTVYSEGDYDYIISSNMAQSGLRMGHIKELVVDGDDEVVLVLKSGEEVFLENGSGDIGDDNREILVDTQDEGIIEFYWDDIEKVEFMKTPDRTTKFGTRLYGTAVTRRGDQFTGYISWDMDEAFDEDILDGRDRHRKRKIRFSSIASIERRSPSSALVTLKNGERLRLDETNDVNSGNRGIVVADPALGRVKITWDDFDYIEFTALPDGYGYDNFDGGRRLTGTVFTEDGEEFAGKIKWDDDEEFTWELLDGKIDDVDFGIEMGNIKEIEKISFRGSRVVLNDGREFRLDDSNDIDEDNKGIIVLLDNDEEVFVDWDDFERVVFSGK